MRLLSLVVGAAWCLHSVTAVAQTVEYETFRDRVQPIFLDKRPGLARCYTCHSQGTPFRLQRLGPGRTAWTEEESRKNFEAIQRLVTPGRPQTSRLLLMPLAHEGGGTEFHPGGKRWHSQDEAEWKALAAWIRGPVRSTASAARPVIVQTNAAGDNIHIIDPASDTVVGEITGIEVNHGAAAAPDGSRFYITNEAAHTLDIVDGRTLKVVERVPLSDRPNNLSISRDGRKVYVAIIAAPGAVDVIDTAAAKLVKTIPTKGGIHNTFVTPDGRFAVAGSIAGRQLTVIDTATDAPVWSLDFDNGVRPIAFDTNADGSTRRMFVQISNFHGFYVVDFTARRELQRIALPELPKEQQNWDTLQGSPSHGIGVAPDGRTLWVCSKVNHAVYAYSLPDLKLLGGVDVGHHPDWLTFTPDSKRVYVANAGSNAVSVVDIATRKELGRVPVGQVPKRNITALWAAPR
jgi:YVTN family beta-propeller protein